MALGWRKGECALEEVPFCSGSLLGTLLGPIAWTSLTTVHPFLSSGITQLQWQTQLSPVVCVCVLQHSGGKKLQGVEWWRWAKPNPANHTWVQWVWKAGNATQTITVFWVFITLLLSLQLKGREAGETIHHFVFALVARQNWGGEQIFCVKQLLFCILLWLILLLLVSISHSIAVCFQ